MHRATASGHSSTTITASLGTLVPLGAVVDGLQVEEMADRAGGEVGVGERQAPQAHVGNDAETTSTNLPDGLGREDASKEVARFILAVHSTAAEIAVDGAQDVIVVVIKNRPGRVARAS